MAEAEYEKYYRKEWMTEDQWKCACFLSDMFGGFHHVNGEIKQCGTGIHANLSNGNWCATYDFNTLTKAVVMAHDRMVRFEICPSGPGMLKLRLWQRHSREGNMAARHPTIEDAIVGIRNNKSY